MPAPLAIPDTAQAPFRDDGCGLLNRMRYYFTASPGYTPHKFFCGTQPFCCPA